MGINSHVGIQPHDAKWLDPNNILGSAREKILSIPGQIILEDL